MPKLTFVLPTKDRIEWVGECIQSILSQTEKDIELVIVNDASTDGTKEFLDNWASQDPRVKIFHNDVSKGAGNARNLGTALESSEIIAVCDDDDVYPKDHANNVLRWFSEHPESELVNFPYYRVGFFTELIEPFYGGAFDHEKFKEEGAVSYFCNPACAFKKSSVQEMGGYPPEVRDEKGKCTLTDDAQFVTNWVKSGKKIDFDNRSFGVLHRVLPNSMMADIRGYNPQWTVKQ